MDDNSIVRLFWDRNEAALSATEKEHGKRCRTVAENILNNREDAEECVNDAHLKPRELIPPNRPQVLGSDEELSAFSSEDATQRVNGILNKLNIPYGTPYIIPVKADTANEYLKFCEERYADFSYTPWTQENELYILIYPLIYIVHYQLIKAASHLGNFDRGYFFKKIISRE